MTDPKMSPEEIRRKIDEIQRRHQAVLQKKATLAGQLEAKKQELAKIIQEIRESGFDPKNLASERDRVQAELVNMIANLEAELGKVETALGDLSKASGQILTK